MPENWESDFMAMCCGLSLAIALGWNVTAGAAEWRELAQNLCLVSPTDANAAASQVCEIASQAQPGYIALALAP